MEDGIFGFLLGILVALLVSTCAWYGSRNVVRDQAVAAGVGCYQSNANGTTEFRWNCKQP